MTGSIKYDLNSNYPLLIASALLSLNCLTAMVAIYYFLIIKIKDDVKITVTCKYPIGKTLVAVRRRQS